MDLGHPKYRKADRDKIRFVIPSAALDGLFGEPNGGVVVANPEHAQ
jgi:hypothetical protein